MKANIVIFGKNSIIAQNFINKDYCNHFNFINISRYSKYKNDINFEIGNVISLEDLRIIALQIKRKLIFKKELFLIL